MKMFCHVNLKHVIIFVVTELERDMSTQSKFACSFYCSFCIESQSPRTGALPKSQFKEMNAI